MALIYAFMVNYRYLQNRSPAWFAQEPPPQALKNILLKQNKPFKGGLPYSLSQKMAAEFVV